MRSGRRAPQWARGRAETVADPRSEMAALRDLGVPPPARPAAPPPEPAPTKAADDRAPAKRAAKRTPVVRPAGPAAVRRAEATDPPAQAPSPQERRSRHTTVYLEAPARARLDALLEADPDATVADAMLEAVRAGVSAMRKARPDARPRAADDPIPAPPRRRRRRRVEDGRAVPVRFSESEREALDRLGVELDLSVSALISTALLAGQSTSGGRPRSAQSAQGRKRSP